MKKILVGLFALFCLVCLPAAASAQDGAATNLGAAPITDAGAACQGDAACLEALRQCRQDLNTTMATAQDALERLNKCEGRARPPVKPAKLVPPQCTGNYMDKATCTCHVNLDGTGDKDPLRIPVRVYGTNLVACASHAELVTMVMAMRTRLEAIEGKVPGWDDAKRRIDTLLLLVSNGEPQQFAAQWTDLLSWYAGAQQAILDLRRDVNVLIANDATTQAALAKLCPVIPDRPQASMIERCDYAARQGRGSKADVAFDARGIAGHRPGAGAMAGVEARGELEIHIPDTRASIVVAGRVGHVWDQDTGRQILTGGEIGPRFYFGEGKATGLGIFAYSTQYWSVHPEGYQDRPGKGMGYEFGLRPQLSHCFSDAFCVAGDVGVGYSPRINSVPHAYAMDAASGLTVTGGLGLRGRIKLH